MATDIMLTLLMLQLHVRGVPYYYVFD